MTFTVAIAGISSRLAREAAVYLLKQPELHLRGSCRDTSKLPAFLKDSTQVTLIQCGPYEIDSIRSLIRGCDVVMCSYWADNETMLEGQKLLIDLCEEEGVKRYIASDYTADYTKLDFGDIEIKDPMKHVHAYLKTRSKVQGVHILIGIIMDLFWDHMSIWDPTRKLQYWGTGNEEWEFTTYHTAGEYTAAVALDHNAVGFQKFVGERITLFNAAKDIEAVLGFKANLERLGSLKDLRQKIKPEGQEQDAFAAGMYYTGSGKVSLGTDLDNSKYPQIKPETFRDWLRTKAISTNK